MTLYTILAAILVQLVALLILKRIRSSNAEAQIVGNMRIRIAQMGADKAWRSIRTKFELILGDDMDDENRQQLRDWFALALDKEGVTKSDFDNLRRT